MPSHFPNSPRLVKGALLEFGDALLGLQPNVIAFQYNPEQLSHSLAQPPGRSAGTESATTEKKETLRTPNLPIESISDLKLILDATDQMEQGDPVTALRGIGPAIAALEMMMFPVGTAQLDVRSLLGACKSGSAKVPPQQLPLVLFMWGPWRVVPVNITSVSVAETEFDPLLNPIRAEVTISMSVISTDDLVKDSFAYGAYAWTHGNRRVNAALYSARAHGLLPF